MTLLLVAGLVWVIVDRAVTVKVDGVAKVVHTRAANVRALLSSLDHRVGRHDQVSPNLSAGLRDGLTIELNRARPLDLTVDGESKRIWVTSRTVADALREVKAPRGDVKVSTDPDNAIPLRGMKLRVATHKKLTLIVGKQPKEVDSYAGTVTELLKEQRVTLDADDRTEPARKAAVTDGITVTVRQVTVRKATEVVTTDPPEERTEDSSLMVDQTEVTVEGSAGRSEETVEYHEADGEVLERKVTGNKVLNAPQPRKLTVGTKEYPADDTGLNWDALAACESGGRPGVVSSNGLYHGLYQFSVQTWQGIGGIGLPSEATPREQTYRAMLLYKRSGAGQWPECGSRLFS